MAGLYDLRPAGAPGIGLTRRNRFASLHGDRLRPPEKSRKPSPPISAPPRDSSSDEGLDGQEVPGDGVSDDSEFGPIEKQGISPRNGMLIKRTNTASAKDKHGQKRELSVEPSNIRASSFTSSKGHGSRIDSQSSQKRKVVDLDDDDVPMSFSQQKKPRQGYGSMNIHKGSVAKPGNPKKVPRQESEKAGPLYKSADYTRTMLAQVDRMSAKSGESEKPIWRERKSMQTSQPDQSASKLPAKSTQASSQNSSKSFKQPLQPSPKKNPRYGATSMIYEEVDDPRAIRSSSPAKKPPVITKANALKSSNLQNAFKNATDKLGISNKEIDLPSSATCNTSAPPTPFDAATTVSSPLSSLDDSTLDSSQEGVPIITSGDLTIATTKPRPAVCPMCKKSVDESYLEQHTKVGTRMSLRQQAQFCKAHKERSAESEWATRGYPKIDWQELDARIAKLHPSMDDVLSRRKFSFYRNAFEVSLKSGKNKTIQESLMGGDEIEGTLPGYYGGRGAKVMAENIMSRFASRLRQLAASDKLISSGGVSRYVQAVIVPELALLLVMDDMKVNEEEARKVLRDSVDLGNLLNEEEDETITDPAPQEREVVDIT